jgi:hypothetical protein
LSPSRPGRNIAATREPQIELSEQRNGDRTPWLIETGNGSKPMAVHFQLRPDPLAK